MKRVLFATLWFFLVAVAMAEPISFPGAVSVAQSPTEQFALVWVEATADQPHQLKLRLANGELRPVMNIERHATIHWAPSGEQFAVTDAFASDQSRVIAYSVSENGAATELPIQLPECVTHLLKSNHHSYLKVSGWSQHGLKLVASGYGANSRKSFCQSIVCNLSTTKTLLCGENHDC